MKYLSFLAGCDWRFLVVLLAAFMAALTFLAIVLTRAKKVDLPFMKISMDAEGKKNPSTKRARRRS